MRILVAPYWNLNMTPEWIGNYIRRILVAPYWNLNQ